jgi:serine/threonine-protein kinase
MQAVTDSTGLRRLVVRDLTHNTVTPIPGTENASGGEFSPEGDWIAFEVDDQLRKVPVEGGPAITLVSSMIVDGPGLAWTPSGEIVFSGRDAGLWQVDADGGTPVQLTTVDTTRREFGHWSPRMLPGGRAMIYTNYATPLERSRIEAYDFRSRRSTVLAEGAVLGRYAPSGHLLYARDGAVFAVEFDPDRLEIRGTPAPVQDDVVWDLTNGLAGYDVSASGTFVYLQASEWDRDRTIVWRERTGRDLPAIEGAGAFLEPRLSPNGLWIVYTQAKPKLELWLYDVTRRTRVQLTRAPSAAFNALWTADSRRIVYTFEDRVYDVHELPIDASGPDRTIVTSPHDKFAQSISPDGRMMLMMENPGRDRMMLVPLDSAGGPPRPLASSTLDQRLAVFSPDGRWIAYTEHGPGQADIYLRSVNGDGGRRLLSVGGGSEPRWTRGGREIVYLGPGSMISVAINPATGEAGTPAALFSTTDLEVDPWGRLHSYDVTPDGGRFLVAKTVPRPAALPLVVVLNWRPELGRPAGSIR